MQYLPMKDKGCLLSSEKRALPKLGQPVQNSQMVPVFLGRRGLLFQLSFCFLDFLNPNFALRKKEGRSDDAWERTGGKNSGKLNVTSHVTNWIASNRKSVAIASDKPLSRETAGNWQTRECLKGTEAFGCKITLDIKHLTSFYFLGGESVWNTSHMYVHPSVGVFRKYHVAVFMPTTNFPSLLWPSLCGETRHISLTPSWSGWRESGPPTVRKPVLQSVF